MLGNNSLSFFFKIKIIFDILGHWNKAVEGLTLNVLKLYMEMDPSLFDRFFFFKKGDKFI